MLCALNCIDIVDISVFLIRPNDKYFVISSEARLSPPAGEAGNIQTYNSTIIMTFDIPAHRMSPFPDFGKAYPTAFAVPFFRALSHSTL